MDELFPYTPRKTKFEVLEATFVARQSLLDELIASIWEQADADTLQHWMILGLRGMGKSHLIAMIYHIVKTDPLMSLRWTPILMNEEEHGVFSLPTLFTRILTKLADELDKSKREDAEKIYFFLDTLRRGSSAPDRVMEASLNFLKDYVVKSGKRLLVLLENADDLFTKCMPKMNEVKQLRKILQHDNDMLMIATSPTFFEGIRSRRGVLYDFFRTRQLDLLTYDQAISLLQKWAEIASDDIGRKFKPGDYRLRVLYHLTGGNPRILLFLYMAIAGQEKFESSVSTFQALLEKDLSNYYLSRLRDIPNQEQPIVTTLAEARHNLTQKEIAERTFLPLRSIGTSMGRLENAGLVRPVTEKKGKNTLYTLTDHMFRLWYQWRTNLREKEVIEALVEFLSIWYRRSELMQLSSYQGIAADYARGALSFRESDRFKGHLEVLCLDDREAFMTYLADRNFNAALDTAENLKEYSDKALRDIELPLLDTIGRLDTIEDLETCLDALKSHTLLNTAAVFLGLASKLFKKDQFDKAEEALNKAIELDPKDADVWRYLGLARGNQGNYAGAEEALNKAVELAPEDADAWRYLGLARGDQGNYTGAEEALNKAIELAPESAKNWLRLGIARERQGNYKGAEEALTKGVELDPEDSHAWFHLGSARASQDNYTGVEEALTKFVELDQEVAGAWFNLGRARRHQGNNAGAEEALTKAVELAPKDADAWCYLGHARGDQGNYTGAEEALNKAVELAPENATCAKCADVWRSLGRARRDQGNYAGAEEALTKAVELAPENIVAWEMLLHLTFHNYRFSDCIGYSMKGLLHTDNKQIFLSMLSEIETRIERVPKLPKLFIQYLQANDTPALQKTYLYFYRAFVLLHGKDFTPFRADLRAGVTLMQTLTEEEKRTVQGGIILYLVDVTYGDDQNEIITYLSTLLEIAPETAAVFSPLDYVIDYLKATTVDRKTDRIKTTKRAETALDRVPTELRAPVEEMVNTIKKNIEWWAKRPKKQNLDYNEAGTC